MAHTSLPETTLPMPKQVLLLEGQPDGAAGADAMGAYALVESDDGSSRVACVEEYEEPVDQLNCENFPDLCQGHPTSGTSSETKDEFPAYAIALMTLTVVCAAAGGFYYFAYEGGDNAEMRKTAEQEMKNQSKPPARAAPVPATSGALV